MRRETPMLIIIWPTKVLVTSASRKDFITMVEAAAAAAARVGAAFTREAITRLGRAVLGGKALSSSEMLRRLQSEKVRTPVLRSGGGARAASAKVRRKTRRLFGGSMQGHQTLPVRCRGCEAVDMHTGRCRARSLPSTAKDFPARPGEVQKHSYAEPSQIPSIPCRTHSRADPAPLLLILSCRIFPLRGPLLRRLPHRSSPRTVNAEKARRPHTCAHGSHPAAPWRPPPLRLRRSLSPRLPRLSP